ncbi:MAG: hypothetical protein K8S56_03680, partial [Candidatus Cloacimonetes bacterium]|nr:hypothetical protein [Candidatus Cloacimonadota bacterium]
WRQNNAGITNLPDQCCPTPGLHFATWTGDTIVPPPPPPPYPPPYAGEVYLTEVCDNLIGQPDDTAFLELINIMPQTYNLAYCNINWLGNTYPLIGILDAYEIVVISNGCDRVAFEAAWGVLSPGVEFLQGVDFGIGTGVAPVGYFFLDNGTTAIVDTAPNVDSGGQDQQNTPGNWAGAGTSDNNGTPGAAQLVVTFSSFQAELVNGSVDLTWVTSYECNIMGYNVLRNNVNNHNTATVITPQLTPATNTNTTQTYTFTDTGIDVGGNYYWIQIISNNGYFWHHGPQAPASCDVSILLQGAYNYGAGDMTLDINPYLPLSSPYADAVTVSAMPAWAVDWVYVQLRTAPTSAPVVEASFLLNETGHIVDEMGLPMSFNMASGNYYAVVTHRNHLAVMSANAITFDTSNAQTFDLTTSGACYYDSAVNDGVSEVEPGIFALLAGETTDPAGTSGTITDADKGAIANNFLATGYQLADTNFSDTVTDSDKGFVNLNSGTACQVPSAVNTRGQTAEQNETTASKNKTNSRRSQRK